MSKIPQGMHSVTPHLVCAGAAKALAFYQKAFGATELGRMPGPDGRLVHAAMKIGDSTVMLADEMPEWSSLGPKAPVAEQFWGDRYGRLEDPFGHHWSVGTHVRDVSPEEMKRAMAQMSAQK